MKLNKAQIEYAFQRINEAVSRKVAAKIGEAPQQKIPEMSFDDKYAAIASGDPKRAKLKSRGEVSEYTDLDDAYTYPAHEVKVAAAHKPMEEWSKKKQAAQKTVAAQAQKIKDKIMLSGDADAALALIDRFAEEG